MNQVALNAHHGRPFPPVQSNVAGRATRCPAVGTDGSLDLLVGEFNHRLRNLLTMVESFVRQTQSGDVEDYRAKLLSRLSALSSFHELIGPSPHQSVRLADLLERTIRPYCGTHDGRSDIAGPDIDIGPKVALELQLILHELATNAHKHGALGSPAGWVKVRWLLPTLKRPKLVIVWSEHGGPRVSAPARKGFGSRLITRALSNRQGNVELSFKPAGVTCRISVALDYLASTDPAYPYGGL
jgi:two-component sensor histidine kinase